ncbi:MAG TPA: hypothetical protein VKA02_07845 [Candidatus Acidoferrum sp.]|nr:hypothetical protein [Candidatus Acidoferrum sp.]
MNEECKLEKRRPEAGAALLIAIFALLLISVVAIALVVSQGTDSALTGNYRTSTSAYYAGIAGLEEGRGRLLMKNANYLNISGRYPGLFTPGGAPSFGLKDVLYIINPASGEAVDPTSANPAQYPDNEYQTEFTWALSAANVYPVDSVFPVAGLPGPLYKWVRITPATEQSLSPPLGIDVDWNGYIDNGTTLNYDPANQAASGALQPGLIVGSTPTSGQALEVTALAVLPNNTQKLVQYLVAPLYYGVSIPATLILSSSGTASPGIIFQVPTSASTPTFFINGNDGSGPNSAAPNCTPTAIPTWAIGVTDMLSPPADYNVIQNAITALPSALQADYTGETHRHRRHMTSLSVEDQIPLSPVMMSPTNPSDPTNLNEMVQTISQNADLVLNRNASDSDMPAAMSATNPMTVVVNGNLTLTNFTGYGLLVVTGNFVSNPNAGWRGVVLVVGAGNVTFTGGPGSGNGEYDGGIFVAQTLDWTVSPPVQLANMGTASFDASNAGGNGIFYNSCWINAALQPPTFQVLSFREIPTN